MRILTTLFVFLVLVLAPVRADDPMTTLRIEVKTLKGKPIDRAAVTIDFVEGRSVAKLGRKVRKHWETRTNQEGVVKLPPIPQGKFRVMVHARGYQTFGDVYDVSEEEKTIEIKMNPPQAQYSAHQ
jgi:hypothetical protein